MNKNKKILYFKLIILIMCFLIVLRIFALVLSKYESEANSDANVDIAFYLFNEDFKQMTLNLDKIFPKEDEYIYIFSIGNEEQGKTPEIDIEYDLTIRTTTNLPLTYELYINDNTESIIQTNEIEQDQDGTYFRKITTNTENLYYQEPKTNIYSLVVKFPESYNNKEYQDIIEMLEITIDSKQMI